MKKVVGLLLTAVMTVSLLTGCGTTGGGSSDKTTNDQQNAVSSETDTDKTTEGGITIGVSIWGTNDPLGNQVKKMLDAEAKALGIKLVYSEHNLKSEEVVASIENLCASGVDGIIVCNSADAEMAKAIPVCQKNGVYLAQFFREITDADVKEMAMENSYYLGTTHEDEEANGYELGRILIEEKNCRNIGITSYRVGDATASARISGYKKAVEDWNTDHADDKVVLGDVVDDKYSAEEARQAVEGMIDANKDMDGLVVVGGGGQSLEGALGAITAKGLTGKISVASTDFTTNLADQLANGEMAAMSGGHYADPFFSLMMVYNAVRGNYERPADQYLEVIFPMMYVASAEDYAKYDKYFIQSLPYNDDEIKAIADESFEKLQETASKLSISEVAERHAQ